MSTCWLAFATAGFPPPVRGVMGKRRSNAAIKRTGNAGNSKKGTKEEVQALLQKRKEQAAATAASSATGGRGGGGGRGGRGGGRGGGGGGRGAATGAAAASAATGDDSAVHPSRARGLPDGAVAAPIEAAAPDPHANAVGANYDLTRWTGKTPTALLYEYCQKQKWFEPEFDVHEKKEGWTCRVRLARRDPKDPQGPVSRKAYFDGRFYINKAEARHFAAVFAMFKINFDKPLHRVLPPGYKDYWLEMEERRVAGLKARKADAAKRRDGGKGIEKEIALHAKPMDPFDQPVVHAPKKDYAAERRKRQEAQDKALAQVRMSEECRKVVEEAVFAVGVRASNVTQSAEDTADLVAMVTKLGFRKAHVQEALQYAAPARSSLLDWLCLHVPEGDLPKQFQPPEVTLASSKHDQASLARELKVRRLVSMGFAREACLSFVPKANDNLYVALRALLMALDHGGTEEFEPMPELDEQAREAALEEQMEEFESLEAIYGSAFHLQHTDEGYLVTIKLNKLPKVLAKTQLEIYFPFGSAYPDEPPMVVVCNDQLPAYVRLSAMKLLREEAMESLGHAAVFHVVSWLEEHLQELADSPPPLSKLRPPRTQAAEPDASDSSNGGQRRKPRSELRLPRVKSAEQQRQDSERLLKRERQKAGDKTYTRFQAVRQKLPAHAFRSNLLECIKDNQVVVVSGETGCGKTTQVPQFVLEDFIQRNQGGHCNIICTQPRRLAAIGVAQRVADERAEPIGDTVGYAIRLERKQSENTRLLFCTTGILLRRLQGDPKLTGVSHIFIDEVHERSLDSDVLLATVKALLKSRKDLKLVLMSATLDSDRFSTYFKGAPTVAIPGFTHPVIDYFLEDVIRFTGYVPPRRARNKKKKKKAPAPVVTQKKPDNSAVFDDDEDGKGAEAVGDWESLMDDDDNDTASTKDEEQEDADPPNDSIADAVSALEEPDTYSIPYDLIAMVVGYICNESEDSGAILVFLPGAGEINRCINAIERVPVEGRLNVYPLHSGVAPKDQKRIFERSRSGERKVVVATNIAETSITIDDVTTVIDTGRVKETQYDAVNSMSMLVETWVSKAAAKQRRGRAGRTRPGTCYKLFSKGRAAHLLDHQPPEILRVPIEQLCLRIKDAGFSDVQHFLLTLLDCPSTESVKSALGTLHDISALDKQGNITALGRHLAAIPCDVRIAKLLIFGAMLQCLDPVLSMACCLSYKSPFVSPMDKREEARAARAQFSTAKSDILTVLTAFNKWQEVASSGGYRQEREWCDINFLNRQTLREVDDLRQQYFTILTDQGFARRVGRRGDPYGGPGANINSSNLKILKAALCAGLYPNVARVVHPAQTYIQMEHGAVPNESRAKEIKMFLKAPGRVFLHPSSVNFHVGKYEHPHLLWHDKVQTSKVFLRDATMISAYPLLLFGGDITVIHERQLLTVDGWIQFRAPARIAVLVNELRAALDDLLARKIDQPDLNIYDSPVLGALHTLLVTDGF
eukprot:m.176717 g.176717  ORF g.176717 m.176717 type:complete len:1482 (-) comp17950_c0_seq3:91-4536(-)